jgi:hypothetical protein
MGLIHTELFCTLDLVAQSPGSPEGDAVPTNVTLLEPPSAGPKGAVYLRYGLVEGAPATGDMGSGD